MGIEFSYEAVRDWRAKLTPTLIDNPGRRVMGDRQELRQADETYIKVNGRWYAIFIVPSIVRVPLSTSGQREARHGGSQGVLPIG